MKKKKNRLTTIILVAMLLVGLSLLLYPSFSDYWNSFHQSRAIMAYLEDVGGMDSSQYDAIMERAHAYNAAIDPKVFRWFLNDEDLLTKWREASGVRVPGDEPEISWHPDLGARRVYTVEGKPFLTNEVWTAPNADSRFFRVWVSLPE